MENSDLFFHHPSYMKACSFLLLRAQDKKHKMRMKKQGRMIRLRKHLKEHIYDNNNIFQVPSGRLNRKSAQNIIWEKNYKLKMSINILKEENSSVKARLWNIQKESRKMDKQIETWNLEKVFSSCFKNKPYIDMMTVSKVFADQDYEIVSTKIDIAKYERILQQKEDEIQRLTYKSQEFEKHLDHVKHMNSEAKSLMLCGLEKESLLNNNQKQFFELMEGISKSLNMEVAISNEKSQYLKKNIELKRKANLAHKAEVELLEKEIGGFKKINQGEIQELKQEMRKIKLEERNNIKDFQKDMRQLRKSTVNYECEIQKDMGEYIKKKIELGKKIEERLKMITNQLQNCPAYQTQIVPFISCGNYLQ